MAATPPGSSAGGIWIQQSTRALANPRVRVGAVPFRELNIDEDEVYDAQRNRLLYVVTESLLDTATFNDAMGAVDILDEQNQSMITPAASLHYLVLSHGKNSGGAYGLYGTQTAPCPAGTLEEQNCDFAADAIYRSTFRGEAGNASDYDDIIRFFSRVDEPLWKRSEIDADDIEELSPNNVAMGSNAATVDLDVEGNMLARPSGTDPGDIHTDRFCEQGGTDCFDHAVIGSAAGMQCPTGQYMTGISAGAPLCSPVVSIRCNNNAFPILQGIDPITRLPICAPVPPNPCADQTISLCSPNDFTLLAGPHGTIRTATAGASRQQDYRCDNGSWVLDGSASGVCTCTAGVISTTNTSCGVGFTGTYTTTTSLLCPSGTTTTTNNFATACTCVGATIPLTQACPSGYSGTQTATQTITCPLGTSSQTPWVGTCSCVSQPDIVTTSNCPTGYIQDPLSLPNPAIEETEFFNMTTCAHDPAITTDYNCICDTSGTYTDTIPDTSCPAGTSGTITRQFFRDGPGCTWGTPTLTPSGCFPIAYNWTTQGTAMFSGASSPGSTSVSAGSSCTYADYSASTEQNCYIKIGSTYDIYKCLCQ